MKTFKTPKGTELPLRDFRGKDYLDVQYRVLWMREEHADWGIETEFLQLGADIAIAKATIKDSLGKVLAQGTKTETPAGFADFVEKSETGAVGRALALCGYGTQFAQELEEGERVVDSPREQHHTSTFPKGKPLPLPEELDDFVIPFGKFQGRTLVSVGAQELRGYYEWLKKNKKPGEEDSPSMKKIAEYVASRTPHAVVK